MKRGVKQIGVPLANLLGERVKPAMNCFSAAGLVARDGGPVVTKTVEEVRGVVDETCTLAEPGFWERL